MIGFGSQANATIFDGGFEAGLGAWFSVGDASESAFMPLAGTTSALLTNVSGIAGAVGAGAIETFLGMGAGALGSLTGSPATEGSAIRQAFTASAGDTISFDFNFITTEATPGVGDFAFVSIVVDGILTVLADTTSGGFVTSPISLPIEGGEVQSEVETGLLSFSHVLTTGGLVELGIGIVDAGDTLVTSGLQVDNVVHTAGLAPGAVPAPGPLALVAFGLLSVGMARRR